MAGALVAVILAGATEAQAQGSVEQVAAKALQIGVGARAAGMGDAQTGVADDAYALYWNPAGLALLPRAHVALMHNTWLGSMKSEYLSYVQPSPRSAFGISLQYLHFGEFQRYAADSQGYPVPLPGSYSPYGLVATYGHAWRLTSKVAFGGAVKAYSEIVDTYNNFTLALDAGFQYRRVVPHLDVGFMVQNLGLPVQGYGLPFNFRAGAAYHLPWRIHAKGDRFQAALDFNLQVPVDQPFYTNVGLEYWYQNTLALRVGYKLSEVNQLGSGSGLTAGLGIRLLDYSLDYALASFGEMGLTHRFSLTVGLGKPRRAGRRRVIPKGSFLQPAHAEREGPRAGEGLQPKLSGLEYRGPVTITVTPLLLTSDKTRLQNATFEIRQAIEQPIRSWLLEIKDLSGKSIRRFNGKNLPVKITWNGRDAIGRLPLASASATYTFTAYLTNGTQQQQSGAVLGSTTSEKDVQTDRRRLEPVYFEEGTYLLSPESSRALDQAAEIIHSKAYAKIIIEGYTDGAMEKSQEFLLSKLRADAVTRYLSTRHQISLSLMEIFSRGSKKPRASNQNAAGQAKNRRVEITIVYPR